MDRKETKGQNMIYKTLHRKLKIEQNEPNMNPTKNRWWSQVLKVCIVCWLLEKIKNVTVLFKYARGDINLLFNF
jgi:Mg2+/citrate symporter